MTHLTDTKQVNIFKTEVRERFKTAVDEGGQAPMAMPMSAPQSERFAVGVDMTQEQSRETMRASWPQYSWPSVVNLTTRHRGKHY